MSQDVVRCFQSPRPLTPHVSRSDSNVTCTCSPAPMSAGAVGQRKTKGHEEGGPSISETGSRPQHPRPKPGRPRPTQEPGEGVICPPPHVTGDESRGNSRSSAQNGAPLGIRRSRHRHLPREFETLSVPDPVGLRSAPDSALQRIPLGGSGGRRGGARPSPFPLQERGEGTQLAGMTCPKSATLGQHGGAPAPCPLPPPTSS